MQQDARHEAIIRMLLDAQAADRASREKRLLGYRQSLGCDTNASGTRSATRLNRFRTNVPCRVTPEARALLDRLTTEFPGCTVSFRHVGIRRQAVLLTGGAFTKPKQIGWVEHCVQSDHRLCNVRDQGLSVDTDGGTNLVLRFCYPPTPVRLSSASCAGKRTHPRAALLPAASCDEDACMDLHTRFAFTSQDEDLSELLRDAIDDTARVDFSEIRPALGARPRAEDSSPRVAWVTSRELETLDDLGSRDYDAFYMRCKLEVQAAIWRTLAALLPVAPSSCCHRGSYYTVVREPDVANGRILERTVDDSGTEVDIGLDRTYDAAAAVDILLLYLEADILADFADIYFTLQSIGVSDGGSLKDEFFTTIHQFWASTPSLTLSYDDEPAAVVRMAQRAVPAPAQAALLKQDWTNLRQSLVDRFGEAGRNAAGLPHRDDSRVTTGPAAWPFASIPAGDVNVGLRVIYRHEWRLVGAHRGAVIRTVVPAVKQEERTARSVTSAAMNAGPAAELRTHETTIERSDTTRRVREIVEEAAGATVTAMKWPRDADGRINIGARELAARTGMGLEAACRESTRDTSMHLGDIMLRMTNRFRTGPRDMSSTRFLHDAGTSSAHDGANTTAADETHVYSTLRKQYEVLTRPVEIQNVVMIAEELPAPGEIDLSWVERHDWILAKVLLDESFRDALNSISRDAPAPVTAVNASLVPVAAPMMAVTAPALYAEREESILDVDTFSGTAVLRGHGIGMAGEWKRGYRNRADMQQERARRERELQAKRERLCDHIRSNILHYQRAIWLHEDPHQRSMRYRKAGTKVPLEWRFELEAGAALTIDELGDRLTAPNVAGQFAAYSGGREADLDQLIDAAAPIGYYGNYAIYPMRPEFGSEDLFSMLHFFKSPWLSANPETGEPEVADPADIVIARDSIAVAGAGERARRITLDTDDVVVDVIRRTAVAPAGDAVDIFDVPDGYRVILESARAIEVVSASGCRDAGGEWMILPGHSSAVPGVTAGAAHGAARTHDAAAESVIRTRQDRPRLISSAGTGAGGMNGPAISERRDGERTTGLLAGGTHEWMIAAQEDRERTRGLPMRAGAAQCDERGIIAHVEREGARVLLAGAGDGRADASVTPTRGPGTCMAGRARDAHGEGVIPAPAGAGRKAMLRAGGAPFRTCDSNTIRAIPAAAGAARVAVPCGGSGVAAVQVPEAPWMIAEPDGARLRPNLIAGHEVTDRQCWTGKSGQAVPDRQCWTGSTVQT